jgi:hypothetical protein
MKGLPKKPTPPGAGGRAVRSENAIGKKATHGMEAEERMEETLGNYYSKKKDSRMEEKRELSMGGVMVAIHSMKKMGCGGKVK